MKRISKFAIVALIVSLVLSGCGGKGSSKPGVSEPAAAPVADSVKEDTESQEVSGEDKNKTDLGDGNQVNLGSYESGKNMELPAEFPIDILPLLEDANINNVITNDLNKGINITYTTKETVADASAFYKQVMEDGEISVDLSSDDNFTILGSKGIYNVAISVMPFQGSTLVQLDATPKP